MQEESGFEADDEIHTVVIETLLCIVYVPAVTWHVQPGGGVGRLPRFKKTQPKGVNTFLMNDTDCMFCDCSHVAVKEEMSLLLTSVVKVGMSTGDLMCVPGGEDRLVSDPMGLSAG